ncbi:hypothetical protein [Lentiprolixibacter aurantiacus]|uniref:Uncharacterized protein n=1 Tax=Lentiprolixibacter aurantiacus TaxID=2993939 RepID=A0AAE3MIP4_9FLAO|nr:hypothetical protein [Lentiprolixibacter aurantiacus]MCX2718026.1 hypothetical protein [Lentiprolixibacter aurantiacus]
MNKTSEFGLKRVIIVALLFMMVGTALELYLLNHYEGTLQLIPIICIGASITTLAILHFHRTTYTIRIYKLVLGLTALSGVYGTFLHLQANFEFEVEMKPTAKTWDLFLESLSGALPSLAPGSMIVLALIGYSYLLLLKQKQ